MTAETIAKALGGRKAGGAWMACCPAHDDRAPSLSIIDGNGGKVLVRCHAGCDQRDVIGALRSRGVWANEGRHEGRSLRYNGSPLPAAPDPDTLKRTEGALALWQASQPAEGTPAETYLRSRGLLFSPPSVLRFHAGLKHHSGGIWPAMVALVTRGTDGAWGRGAAWSDHGSAVGRRGHRKRALGHAGDRTSGMGRTLGFRAARARIAGGGSRCRCPCRWRRARGGGSARRGAALETRRAARSHRPSTAWV
jgi:hypothetical protein